MVESEIKQIPEHLLSFVPTDNEIFIRGSQDKFVRLIYANMALYDVEQKAIDGYQQFLKDNDFTIDPSFFTYERKVLRYL